MSHISHARTRAHDHTPHLDKVGVLGVARDDRAVHVVLERVLLRVGHGHIVLGQPRLARAVLQQYEADHGGVVLGCRQGVCRVL